MKKIIAIILSLTFLLTSMMSLSGCSTTAESALKMGYWLSLISDSFGMNSYSNEQPAFSKISKDNEYFPYFQMAAEWNIIDVSDSIDENTPLKWNDVLISLVNAGEFLSDKSNDDEKIEWAIKNLDKNIRKYWGGRFIQIMDAVPLLDTAEKLWANKTFSKNIEKVNFKDNVINNIRNNDLIYEQSENVVITSKDQFNNLSIGDVYTLPANDNNSSSINRVKNIDYQDDKIIITNDEEFGEDDALEYIDEIKIEETTAPDFTKVAGIFDEQGNPILFDTSDGLLADGMSLTYDDMLKSGFISNSDKTLSPMVYKGGDVLTQQMGLFDNVKGSLKFKVGDYNISLGLTKDDVSVQLSKEISKSSNRYREKKTKIFGGVKFTGVRLTKDIDYSWGTLHSATLKLDYKTVIEAGVSSQKTGKIGNPVEKDSDTDVKKGISSIVNQYKDALKSLKNDVNNSKCDDDIYICRIALVEGGLASVDFIIKGKVTAEGEIKLSIEIEGSQGLEYKNGKLRYIKSKDVDPNIVADGKVEVTIGPGFAITLLKKIALAEITIDLGAGISFQMKAHLFDHEMHELYSGDAVISSEDATDLSNENEYTSAEEILEFAKSQGKDWKGYEQEKGSSVTIFKGICAEWAVYPIVRIGLDGKSLIGKLAKKFGVTVSLEVVGSSTTLLKGHIDIPEVVSNVKNSNSFGEGLSAMLGIGASCAYDIKPWDDNIERAEEKDPTPQDNSIAVTNVITLSEMRIYVDEGSEAHIEVTGLPKGYTLKDIEATAENSKIAEFDIKQGSIKGIKEGTTQLTVKTKDGKHKQTCAITVNSGKKVQFNPLPNTK